LIVSFESKQMKCPICNDDIPTAALRPHLTAMQHEMDEGVAKCIVHLLERIEKLEQKDKG
jgi:hypothetical protein